MYGITRKWLGIAFGSTVSMEKKLLTEGWSARDSVWRWRHVIDEPITLSFVSRRKNTRHGGRLRTVWVDTFY